nr:ATP-binding cassette domain-containing protein [Candidatus Njordarchaeum guaymaensis]
MRKAFTEPVVEVRDLQYSYPDGTRALRGVNFRVLRGESVALLGPNGAGKSTLLLHLDGLLTPAAGSISILGRSTSEKKNLKFIRSQVGLVFQNPDDQLFQSTLWDEVAFGPLNLGLSKNSIVRRVNSALKIVGLSGLEKKAPHHLSLGEKRRAAIATVLAMDPEILVLDEPTANLDPKGTSSTIELLRRLNVAGKTIIIATHDVNIVPLIADRCFIMSYGRITSEGPVDEILSNAGILSEANLCPPYVAPTFMKPAAKYYQVRRSSST